MLIITTAAVAPPCGLSIEGLLCGSGPAAVSNLTVTAANTSSLSFSWRPSDGHVDIYELSLYSVTETMANHREGSGKERHQVGARVHRTGDYIIAVHYVTPTACVRRPQASWWTCRRSGLRRTAACSPGFEREVCTGSRC